MSDRILQKRAQRQAGWNEGGFSCALLVRMTQKTPDCLMGHAVLSGNLAQGFVVFTDAAYHIRPCFRWNAMVRFTWTRMLLRGDERGNITQDLLEDKKSLIELAVRDEKVDQHC